MDLSDGLADAVTQLAEASGTGAPRCCRAATAGRGEAMVFSPRPRPDPRRARRGDDYELLFTVSPRRGRLRMVAPVAGPRHHTDRRVDPVPDIVLAREGARAAAEGFTHF